MMISFVIIWIILLPK